MDDERHEDPRRRLLIRALAAGSLTALVPGGGALGQTLLGSRPQRLPAGRSVFRITGTATVNGQPATLETPIRPGDSLETGRDSELIFVVGTQAMLLRSEAKLVIEGDTKRESGGSLFAAGLRLLTGALLSVSRDQKMRIATPMATIGIRGTGWYAESDPGQTYFCNCYGVTDVSANADPQSRESVESKYHDRPLYIVKDASPGKAIRPAPFINHTDQELALIEALVGRSPPFVFSKDDYLGPRRDY